MLALLAEKYLRFLGLLVVCSISAPTFAQCGAQITCKAANNRGNSLHYCESDSRDSIMHLSGVYQEKGPRGAFRGTGSLRVKNVTEGRGYVQVNYPGWGYITAAGPMLVNDQGEMQRLAWIDIQHEMAGERLPLSDVRVTLNLAKGCVITDRLEYENCELIHWKNGH